LEKDKIVVVDDEGINLTLIASVLKDEYEVLVTVDSTKTLKLVKQSKPSLILLDISMPKLDGYQVAQLLQKNKELSKIPIIFLTAKTDTASIVKGFESGAVDFISKPFIKEELKIRVKTHIENYKLKYYLERKVQESIEQIRQKDTMLFQQSKMASMGEMIGNIAHQWRQPLNVLGLLGGKHYLDYKEGNLTPEVMEKFKNKFAEVIESMSQTIDDFREFFHPNKSKSYFFLNEPIDKTINMVSNSYNDNNIEIIKNIDKKYQAFGYKNELMQVFLIILNNSKDAIKEKKIKYGKVSIDIKEKNEDYIITFIDNGGGIDDSIIDKICEPYFTTKFKHNGTGIGLYMSKMIIEKSMQGELFINNFEDGVKVRVTIPKERK